jgi:hypothetical protein
MISWHASRYYYDLLRGLDPGSHSSHAFLANLFLPEHDVIDVWSEEMLRGAHDSLALNIQQLSWADSIKKGLVRATRMTLPDPSNPLNW